MHFHTAFAMSLEMLAILHISLVIKIPKGTKISTRDRGHIAADIEEQGIKFRSTCTI